MHIRNNTLSDILKTSPWSYGRLMGGFTGILLALSLTGCNEATIRSIDNSSQGTEFSPTGEMAEAMPPERPAHLGGTQTAQRELPPQPQEIPREREPAAPQQPQVVAVAPPTARAVEARSTRPTNPDEILGRANQFFNSFNTLSGNFTQIGSDGRQQTGQIYLLRPGRMRFDYNAPSALQIVADGRHVAVRNTQSGRQDLYPLSQTPLKFLLAREVRLDNNLRLIRAWTERDGTMLTLEDHSTLGGTARITLFFDPAVTRLKSWDVTDTQGKKTSVALSNLSMNEGIRADHFVIPNKYRN